MFFNKQRNSDANKEFIVDSTLLETRVDPYARLKQLYFRDFDGQKLILNIGNQLKDSNAIMQYDDGTIWKCSYIGKVLTFLNTTIQQINSTPHLSSAMHEWIAGKLPVNVNPQIEIGPDKILAYTLETIKKYPTGEYKEFCEQFEKFKAQYDKCELASKVSPH